MDEKQQETARQVGGLVLVYGVFCVIALGIYAWSVRRSHQIMQKSLDELARERAAATVPRTRRAAPKVNGSATMDE